jgi:hypothetical protein
MITKNEQDKMWFDLELIPGTKFRLNDPVVIMQGSHQGQEGCVISLESLVDDPVYLVELESGEDIKIQESFLSSNLRASDQGRAYD